MAKKQLKKYKVGLNSETYAISLVEFPAIEEELIALEKQEPVKIQLSNDEKHMVYSAVLIPDKPIYRRNAEGEEYYLEFSKESIEAMEQDFMRNYRQAEITLQHEDIVNEVTVVETWVKTDLYKDKSVALGLNESLPIGTWFAGMKVNNLDVWDKIKDGSIKGFSVESLISLEDFNKVEEMEDETMFKKVKEWVKEILGKADEEVKLEEEKPTVEETPTETPTEATETPTEPTKAEEPTVTPPVEEKPSEEPKNEPKNDNGHLEELVNNLKAEIEALKELNQGMADKIKDLSKQPSTKPVNAKAKPTPQDTYSQWRQQMAQYLS